MTARKCSHRVAINSRNAWHCIQGRINHSGGPYQRTAGALFSYAYPEFSLLSGALFLLQKVGDLFLAVSVTFRPAYTARSNVNTACVKIWQLIGGWYNRHNG